MKKTLRIISCFVAILAVISLPACKDINSVDSSTQSVTFSQYESSLTDSRSPISDNNSSLSGDTAQIESSDTSSTKTNTSVISETNANNTSSSSSSATAAPSSVHTHSYSSEKIAATCTADGYTLKTCVCGHSEKSEKVSALGHSWGDWITVKEASYTSTGLQRRTCTRCGEINEQVSEKLAQLTNELQFEILRLVNEERAKHGLNALQYYSAGQSAADVRATEINTLFDHTRPNGTSCFTALNDAGITYRAAGENIASGHITAEEVMEGWMNSEGHRNNILSANFTHLIVGVNGNCWVQLFLTV